MMLKRAGSLDSECLGKELGSGSDGVVYTLKGDVVAKIVSDRSKLEHAARELELHRSLPPHPNIVRCFTGVVTSGQVMFSLERCADTLWSAISHQPAHAGTFTMPDGATERMHFHRSQSVVPNLPHLASQRGIWTLNGTSALEHLHSQGIVHRDLNPFNIFLALDGQQWVAKVGDLGVAALETDCSEGIVVSSNSLVASEYSAPEMDGPHGIPADIFSWGKVLLAMWHSSSGHSGCEASVCAAIADGDLAGLHPSPVLQSLVAECLQAGPSQRPTINDVALQLGALLKKAAPSRRW